MKETIEKIKTPMSKECSDTSFIHHSWYWKYHILPVRKAALELAEMFNVDKDLMELIAYLHDVGKMRGLSKHPETGAKIALGILDGVPNKELIIECIAKHGILSETDPIEVKLFAAADAIGHFRSPFFEIYLWENPDKDFKWLCESNLRKAEKDWNRILIPEVKELVRKDYEEVIKRNEV